MSKNCQIENCDCKHYALGFCRKHYVAYKRNGFPGSVMHKCGFEMCETLTKNEFCSMHSKGISGPGTPSGSLNANWRGGTSEYKNHYTLKLNRKKRIEICGNKCEACGSENPKYAYHLDGDKSNHDINNLVMLCQVCISRRISSLYSDYGMTIKEMSDKFGGSVSKYYGLHRSGNLKKYIEERLSKNENCNEVEGRPKADT